MVNELGRIKKTRCEKSRPAVPLLETDTGGPQSLTGISNSPWLPPEQLVSQQVGTNLPRGILYGLAGRGGGRRTSRPHHYYTVKKLLRSINLLFSCMFRIERKIVHVFTEKILTIYNVELDNFSLIFIDAEENGKNIYVYFNYCSLCK